MIRAIKTIRKSLQTSQKALVPGLKKGDDIRTHFFAFGIKEKIKRIEPLKLKHLTDTFSHLKFNLKN
jgi:hypothetical protein